MISRKHGGEMLFIVISDLISSREAVLSAASLCRRTGNRMLVIQTFDDWYSRPSIIARSISPWVTKLLKPTKVPIDFVSTTGQPAPDIWGRNITPRDPAGASAAVGIR